MVAVSQLRSTSHIYSTQGRRLSHHEDETAAQRGSQQTHGCIANCVRHNRFSDVKCSAECHKGATNHISAVPERLASPRPPISLARFDYGRFSTTVYHPFQTYTRSAADGPRSGTHLRSAALRSGQVW